MTARNQLGSVLLAVLMITSVVAAAQPSVAANAEDISLNSVALSDHNETTSDNNETTVVDDNETVSSDENKTSTSDNNETSGETKTLTQSQDKNNTSSGNESNVTAKLWTDDTNVEAGEKAWLNANASESTANISHYEFHVSDRLDIVKKTEQSKISFTYRQIGEHQATVIVVDENGNRDKARQKFEIYDETSPTATVTVPERDVKIGEQFTVNADASDNGKIETICWYFDEEKGPHDKTAKHSFDEPGAHAVTFIVEDEAGNKDAITRQVTVVDPDAKHDPTPTPDKNKDKKSNKKSGSDYTKPASSTPSVTVDDSDDKTSISVENANQNDPIVAEFPTSLDASAHFSGTTLWFESDGTYQLTATTAAQPPSGVTAPTPESDGFEAITYLSLAETDSDAVSDATFAFTVDKVRLNEMGVQPSDVVLYRNVDGSWEALETDVVGETDGAYEFEAASPGLSVFAVGVNQPSFEVTSVDLNMATVSPGDSVEITATVANNGRADGVYAAEFSVLGDIVDAQDVSVAAGDSVTVTATYEVDEPGSYTVSVGDAATNLAVDEPEPTESPGQPGFGPVVALFALAGLLLALRQR